MPKPSSRPRFLSNRVDRVDRTGRSTTINPNNTPLLNAGVQNIVIIGDTAEALIFAYRVYRNRPQVPIFVFCEGVDRLCSISNLEDTNFVIDNMNTRLNYFKCNNIRYNTPGRDQFEEDFQFPSGSIVTQLFTGWGPCGNYQFTPLLDIGPWFPFTVPNNITGFIDQTVQMVLFSSVEEAVALYIQGLYNLDMYDGSSEGVVRPSVTLTHRYLREGRNKKTYRRNIYRKWYDLVRRAAIPNTDYPSTISLYTEVSKIKFSINAATDPNPTPDGLYNVDFDACNVAQPTLFNSKVIFKTFQTTYQRIAHEGGMAVHATKFAATYRAVIPMSLAAAGLSNIVPGPDLVTSRVSFSLPDISSKYQSNIGWLISAYTGQEDLTLGTFAQDGPDVNDPYTLLIVEGLCFPNTRKVRWNNNEKENEVILNQAQQEDRYLYDFKRIVNSIYFGYTGTNFDPNIDINAFPDVVDVCQNGVCVEQASFTDKPITQVAPLIIANTLLCLYPCQSFMTPSIDELPNY